MGHSCRRMAASHRPGVNDVGGSGEVLDEGAKLQRRVGSRFLGGAPGREEKDGDTVALSADLPCAPLLDESSVSNLNTVRDISSRRGTSLKEHDLRLKLC